MLSAAITVVLVLTILSIGLSVAVEDLRATAGLETGSVVVAVAVTLFVDLLFVFAARRSWRREAVD